MTEKSTDQTEKARQAALDQAWKAYYDAMAAAKKEFKNAKDKASYARQAALDQAEKD